MEEALLRNSLIILLVLLATTALGDSTNDNNSQTNSSGSNTQITGGYTSTTTNNNDGQTNTTTSTTTNNSTTNGSDIPVNSASAPSYSAMSQDVCSMGVSGGVSTGVFGLSGGKHVRDLNCERIKLAKVLFDFNMKIGAISLLCQDERVFFAMEMAGTPCPFEGKIGKEALEQWNKYDIERPDYESYVSKLEIRSRIDAELAEIARQKEARILTEEKAKKEAELAKLKEEDDLNDIIIETKEIKIINVHGE